MHIFISTALPLIFAIYCNLHVQPDISRLPWLKVATGMPENWYGSDESVKVAENVLLYQRDSGGWPKNIEKHKTLSESEKTILLKEKGNSDAIFDNSATTTEMRFLAKVYVKKPDQRYKESFNKGLRFILEAQYENGGWPMFYPLRKGYYTHITFNDNAIVNILTLLRDIKDEKAPYPLIADKQLMPELREAFTKGIKMILKTQIIVNGKPTVWCAQHDEITLLPAKARAYELESFSGGESAGIVKFLMQIPDPGPGIIKSVDGAVEWFRQHQLNNVKLEYFTDSNGLKDRRVVTDSTGGSLWARFYDLQTGKPFFCDRDGIKRNSLAEIGYERRNGYSWFTEAPREILDKYPEWKSKLEKSQVPDSR
jgi:pectinesterase